MVDGHLHEYPSNNMWGSTTTTQEQKHVAKSYPHHTSNDFSFTVRYRSWGARGRNAPQKFEFVKNVGIIQKNLGKDMFRSFSTILMKLHYLVIECTNKSLLCHKKQTKYK